MQSTPNEPEAVKFCCTQKSPAVLFPHWEEGSDNNGNVTLDPLNPSSPNSDQNEISLYIITTCSNIQVMRIKKVITNDKIS